MGKWNSKFGTMIVKNRSGDFQKIEFVGAIKVKDKYNNNFWIVTLEDWQDFHEVVNCKKGMTEKTELMDLYVDYIIPDSLIRNIDGNLLSSERSIKNYPELEMR